MWSEIIATLVGGLLTYAGGKYINRLQKMRCPCVMDDVQSKITVSVDGHEYNNVYLKEFELVNTTSRDYEKFNVVFSFDDSSIVIDCHSESKEGIDWQKIAKHQTAGNKAVATVKNFNRGDKIIYRIRVGNVTENKYEVIESGGVGFKITTR